MSATDRIRGVLAVSEGDETIIVYRADAQALCDLADAAREHGVGCLAAEFGDRCSMCAALARLDGEDGS